MKALLYRGVVHYRRPDNHLDIREWEELVKRNPLYTIEVCEGQTVKAKPWYETASEWACTECGAVNPMTSDVCSGCDCSLDGFVDDSWLYDLEGSSP